MALKEFLSKLERMGLDNLKEPIINFLIELYSAGKSAPFQKVWYTGRKSREERLLNVDGEVLKILSQLNLIRSTRKCNESSAGWTLYEISLTRLGEDIASEAMNERLRSEISNLVDLLKEYPKTLLKILAEDMIALKPLHEIPIGWAFMEVPPLISKIKKDPAWSYGSDSIYRSEIEWVLERARIQSEKSGIKLDTREGLEKYFWIAVSWHPLFRERCETLLRKLVDLGLAAFKSLYTKTCHNYSDVYIIPPQVVSFIKSEVRDYNKPSREMLTEFLYEVILIKARKKITREECISLLRLLDLTEREFSEYLDKLSTKGLTSGYDMLSRMSDTPFIVRDEEGLMQELGNRFKIAISLLLTK